MESVKDPKTARNIRGHNASKFPNTAAEARPQTNAESRGYFLNGLATLPLVALHPGKFVEQRSCTVAVPYFSFHKIHVDFFYVYNKSVV